MKPIDRLSKKRRKIVVPNRQNSRDLLQGDIKGGGGESVTTSLNSWIDSVGVLVEEKRKEVTAQ